MVAPAVAPTGAAQVAEPMNIIEPEKKSAEKRSHDNLDDPEIDAAAKRGGLDGRYTPPPFGYAIIRCVSGSVCDTLLYTTIIH